MNENLKVNSKTDILEFKRKHNLLVENGTIKANVSNIKELTNDVINNLRCGDVVLKEDSTGKHAYLVSFKSDTGLCLTYVDASCVETQSYDKSGNNWVYNSEDKSEITTDYFQEVMAQGEPMNGYSASLVSFDNTKIEVNPIYVGACKNGNKITFVAFLSFTRKSEDAVYAGVAFNIPELIGSKLFPFEVGGSYYLDLLQLSGVQKSDWSRITCNVDITKVSNTQLVFAFSDYYARQNEETYIRIEETFLLSDNLIPSVQSE